MGNSETEKLKRFLLDEMEVKSIRFPNSVSLGIKPVSVEGTERLIKQAIKMAIERKLPSCDHSTQRQHYEIYRRFLYEMGICTC